jgi:hypothetical protein
MLDEGMSAKVIDATDDIRSIVLIKAKINQINTNVMSEHRTIDGVWNMLEMMMSLIKQVNRK